ncbi:MAG TPA: ABC transporter permease [Pyrinomonadaceae bacterium]|jgi:lipopolysaccharide transport system permease protein
MGTTSSSNRASTLKTAANTTAAAATTIDTTTQATPPPVTDATSQQSLAHTPPDEPLVTIQANKTWGALNLREIWVYRELLYFLMWRDLKVRYKQTVLGVLWVIMQPLLMTLIFTIFLGMLARVPSQDVPYPLFVYAGLLPWTFFSSAVLNSGNSLVGSAHLITKVYFPRVIIPAASTGARLVDFAIAFVILLGLMIYYGVAPSRGLLMLPVLVALVTLLALGLGMWISALNVRYRDIGIALPVLIQLWMFVSPVLYPSTLVPQQWQHLYALNPLVGIVDGFRSSLFARPFNWTAIAISAVFTVVLLVYAAFAFQRMEKSFADVV